MDDSPSVFDSWPEKLRDRYSEPWRFYHGVGHIEYGLRHFKRHWDNIKDPFVTIKAWLYHDAVFVLGSPYNEACSALLARQELALLEIPEESIVAIEAMILATGEHLKPHAVEEPDRVYDGDTSLLLDIDMSPIGASVEAFGNNTELLREECVTKEDGQNFDKLRVQFLAALRARKRIFRTQYFAHLERQAQANIAQAIYEYEKQNGCAILTKPRLLVKFD